MTYEELLKELEDFDVSALSIEQLKTLKESLMIKTSLVNYYYRVKQARKKFPSNSQEEKCED